MEDAPCCGKFLGGPVSGGQIFAKGTETWSRRIIHATTTKPICELYPLIIKGSTTGYTILDLLNVFARIESRLVANLFRRTREKTFPICGISLGPARSLLVTDAETSHYSAEVTVNQRRNWTEERRRGRRKIRSFPKGQQNSTCNRNKRGIPRFDLG